MTRTMHNESIGSIFREQREAKNLSLEHVSQELHIKRVYLEAIEADNFDTFYSHTHAKGFMQNYARLLEISRARVLALYRRDVENKEMQRKVNIASHESESSKNQEQKISFVQEFAHWYRSHVVFTYKRAALLGIFLVLLTGIFTIASLVSRTFSAPKLVIVSPVELSAPYIGELTLDQQQIIIRGETEANTVVRINNEPITVLPDLSFRSPAITLREQPLPITIIAENTVGAENSVTLTLSRASLDIESMLINITVGDAAAPLYVSADNVVQFNDTALANTALVVEALNTFTIRSPRPEAIQFTVNGQDFSFPGSITIVNTGTALEVVDSQPD